MKTGNKLWSLMALLALLSMVVSCGPTPQTIEKVSTSIVKEEVTRVVEVPVEVEVEVEKVVTATPEPTAEPSQYGGTLIVTYSKDLASLDPPKAWATMDWGTAAQLLYETLYVFTEENEFIPVLADGWPEVSDDGLVYTIHLKQGILFHNGREPVADDVKYSIERNAKPDSGTWNATAPLVNIVGGQAVIDGEADTAEGIKVLDDYTIEFTLLEPDVYLETSFTLVTNAIVPREEVEKWGEDFSFNPVGTGPFMMEEWVAGERITFVRNPNFHVEGLPYLDKIVYELGAAPEVSMLRFDRGEVDVLGDGLPAADIARVASDPYLSQYFINTQTRLAYFMGFNLETPPFDNPDVRKAIAMAIDKDRLFQLASNTGRVAHDWFPPTHFGCGTEVTEPLYPYDPEAAKQLLADAGYPDGFEIDVFFNKSRPWIERIPEALQQDLAAIGVKVELLQLETSVANEMVKAGDIPFFTATYGATFPDPYGVIGDMFMTSSTYAARFRYSNLEVDDLAAQAIRTADPDARCELWMQAQELILEDLPAVPLFLVGYPDVRSPRVEGFMYNNTYHRPYYELLWIPEENR